MFKIILVAVVEGCMVLAVDIEHGNDAILVIHWYHYFAARGGTTGDMSGKSLHVGDYEGAALLPGGAADTATIGDVHTCHRALERT